MINESSIFKKERNNMNSRQCEEQREWERKKEAFSRNTYSYIGGVENDY